MITILKTLREPLPAARLIGKRYTDTDRDAHGTFSEKWGQWHTEGWFDLLERCGRVACGDYLGAMRCTDRGFEYWIGLLMEEGTAAPEGFESVELPAGELAVCYLYGRDGSAELYGMDAHNACVKAWEAQNWHTGEWYFERYNCPRYTVPDDRGNVILDYCAYLEK